MAWRVPIIVTGGAVRQTIPDAKIGDYHQICLQVALKNVFSPLCSPQGLNYAIDQTDKSLGAHRELLVWLPCD